MIRMEHATLEEKLQILSDAAKYDVACTSSGVSRKGIKGAIGNTEASGICHAFSGDGRCISLLKILFTNECIYNCKYCINRASNDVPRATFTPEEVCQLTMEFYRRNYIEGLFLSSGIVDSPDYTMELIGQALHDLRVVHRFNGYIHCKAIPGASPELVEMVGWYADRMSVNMELPTAEGLRQLAPNKSRRKILTPMRQLQNGMEESRQALGMKGGNRSAYWYTSRRMGRPLPDAPLPFHGELHALRGDRGQEKSLPEGDTSGNPFGNPSGNIAGNPTSISEGMHGREGRSQRMDGIGQDNSVNLRRGNILPGNGNVELRDKTGPEHGINDLGLKKAVTDEGSVSALSQWRRQDTSRGFVPAGQSTQMIIGATGESDFEIITVSEALYRRFDLKRVFYSAFVNVNQDASLPAVDGKPPLLREHRLYQADFLLRYYGFEAGELLSDNRPNFNVFFDPKCDWALGHMEQFPVEVNTAEYNLLLRVPGIGVKSASRIVKARKTGSLDFMHLKKIGVVLKRAIYFITCNGRLMYDFLQVEEDFITRRLVGEEKEIQKNMDQSEIRYRQMSLFDDFHMPEV